MTLYVQKDVYHNVPGGTHGCNRLCFRSVSHCLIVIVRANYFTSLVPLQTLENVLLRAVELNGFWAWGAGGDIKKVEPPIIKLV